MKVWILTGITGSYEDVDFEILKVYTDDAKARLVIAYLDAFNAEWSKTYAKPMNEETRQERIALRARLAKELDITNDYHTLSVQEKETS